MGPTWAMPIAVDQDLWDLWMKYKHHRTAVWSMITSLTGDGFSSSLTAALDRLWGLQYTASSHIQL